MRPCLFLLLLLATSCAAAQTPTYFAAGDNDSPAIAALRKQLDSGNQGAYHPPLDMFWQSIQKRGAPLIEATPNDKDFSLVTFLWHGDAQTRNVVLFDGVAGFDAKDLLLHLGESSVWYKTYRVRKDARFAYSLSTNDSLEPLSAVHGDDEMRNRLAMLKPDPLNPHRCPTTFGAYGTNVSYVELPNAPPLLWASSTKGIPQGKVAAASIQSSHLQREKKLWIYTPPGFHPNGPRYPLLVLFDGDRNVDWIPRILDLLIAQKRIPPIVAVMTDDSLPPFRRTELPCNPQFGDFLAEELVPWARKNLNATIEAQRTIVAGSSYGGLASVFAGLKHSGVFGNVISLSGSFFWKPDEEKESGWLIRQAEAAPRLPLRFYLQVGLMEDYTIQVSNNRRMRDTLIAKGYPVHYSEYDGGHSFLNWSVGMADGLQFLLADSGRGHTDSSPK